MQGYEPSYRPEYSPWEPGRGAPDYASGADGVPVKRSRPWLVAIVATMTLLVLIAGLCNQKVTQIIEDHIIGNGAGSSFANSALRTVIVYGWRFTPRSSDVGNVFAGSFAFIGATLVLTLLLVAVLTRGRGGFGQVFVAVWVSVVIATMLAAYVRATVLDANVFGTQTDNKATAVFFSAISPGAFTCAAGIAYGFVVALVAAIVGSSARRTELIGATPGVGVVPPGPAYQPPVADPAQQWAAPVPGPLSNPSPWSNDPSQRRDDGDQHTAVLPAVDQPPAGRPSEDQPTQVQPTQLQPSEDGQPQDRPTDDQPTPDRPSEADPTQDADSRTTTALPRQDGDER